MSTLIVPPRYSGKIEISWYCPDDTIYWIDDRGRVHTFKYQGRLVPDHKDTETDV